MTSKTQLAVLDAILEHLGAQAKWAGSSESMTLLAEARARVQAMRAAEHHDSTARQARIDADDGTERYDADVSYAKMCDSLEGLWRKPIGVGMTKAQALADAVDDDLLRETRHQVSGLDKDGKPIPGREAMLKRLENAWRHPSCGSHKE